MLNRGIGQGWSGSYLSPQAKSVHCVNLDQKGWDSFSASFLFSVVLKTHFNFILVNTKHTGKCLLHQRRGGIHNSCIFQGIREFCHSEEKSPISRKIMNVFFFDTDEPCVSCVAEQPLLVHSQMAEINWVLSLEPQRRKFANPAHMHTVSLQSSALQIPVFTVFLWACSFFLFFFPPFKRLPEATDTGRTWRLNTWAVSHAVRRQFLFHES